MAVIINEFEIVSEPPRDAVAPAPASAPPTQSGQQHDLMPFEIEQLLRQELERALRVWAH